MKRRHQLEQLQANKQLKEAYKGMEDNLKNAKEQEDTGLSDLNASIEKLFTEFQRSNDIKWENFESSANVILATAKSEYCEDVRKIIADRFDKKQLKQKEKEVRDTAERRLIKKINPRVAKPEFLQKMVEDFRKHVGAHFSKCLEDFQTQLEEDEITVRAALMEAKEYYNDEMNKRVNAKDWLDPEELSRINAELTGRAITAAKEKVLLEKHQEKYLRDAMKVVYLKYVEENARKRPVENPAIGIDLGTTYSCVGVFINGEVKIIPDTEMGEFTTVPSYVAFKADHTIVVGEPAKSEALLDSLNTIFDAKRLIGRSYDDPIVQKDMKLWPFDVVNENNIPKIKARGKTFSPEQISSKVIIKMKQIAESYLGKKVYQAVVTVPGHFNDAQRQATRDAAKIAGLNATVLNEPTAAAMAYKLHRTDDLKRNVLVFDLGGGTFDVAVLEMKGGEIKVKATGGDTHLGGEDFDNNMVDDVIKRVKRTHGIDLGRDRDSSDTFKKNRTANRLRRVRDQCEKAKRNLSSTTITRILIDSLVDNFHLDVTFTRDEFERLNKYLFEKCIKIVQYVLKDAKLDKEKVDDIVLVGGSTRIWKVRELLQQFFDGKKDLCSTINADEAIAQGAAIHAAFLNGKQATDGVFINVIMDVQQNFKSSANVALATAKSEYCEDMKKLIKDCFDEDIFKQKEIQVRDKVRKRLIEKLNSDVAKPEFLEKIVEDLKKHMEEHFSEYLHDFQEQMEEDELTVRVVLMEAKQYYNDEMNKRFNSKDWLDPQELSRINAELTGRAIATAKKEVHLEERQEKYLREAMKVVYLKYEENNTLRLPVENPAIGIDLGTSNSFVGVFINGEVKIIPDKEVGEAFTVPSYVAFKEDHTIVVGEPAKSQAFLDPLNTIFHAKRLIGRSFDDPIVQKDMKLWPFDVVGEKNIPKIKVRGKTFYPEQISAKVIFKMKQIAESYLRTRVHQAVITVPGYFKDRQREATTDAAKIAGLKVVTVLDEPTAAAMAYKLHRTDDLKRNVLIFDLKKENFDVSVLEIKRGVINVKATGGDTHLGGKDFDNNMVDDIIERVKRMHGIDLGRDRDSADTFKKARSARQLQRLRDQCEIAKKRLSSVMSTVIIANSIGGNFNLEETFTKDEFERLNNDLFEKCIKIVKYVLKDANLDKAKVDDIVLVGGSTRIPKVRELLKQFFDGKKELCSRINADEAIARGAAVQAALLNGEQATRSMTGLKLIDVAPLSIGMEDSCGRMVVIIRKNSEFPCSHTQTFETVVNNQTEMGIKLYEGEITLAVENNFLGKFVLKGIARAHAGKEFVDLTLMIDKEGILHCKAVCRSNGKSIDTKIETYNKRMSTEEIADAKLEKLVRW